MTVHISNLGEIVDPGSDKTTDEELELNAPEKLKEDDNESVGVMSEAATPPRMLMEKKLTVLIQTLLMLDQVLYILLIEIKWIKTKISLIFSQVYTNIL